MSKVVTVWIQDGHLHVKFDYNPSLIQALKDSINWKKRRWNGRTTKDRDSGAITPNPEGDNSWVIDLDQSDVVEQLAAAYGYEILMPECAAPVAVPTEDDPYRLMFGKLPLDVLKKFYQQIQLKFHPDVTGGDDSIVKDANAAWVKIQEEKNGSTCPF